MRRCHVLVGVCLLVSMSLAALPRKAFTKDGICPKGWWRRYFRCYGILPAEAFHAMDDVCSLQSGFLTSLNTEEENDFITSLLQDNGVSAAGISLLNMASDGSFVWGDASSLEYNRWFGGSAPDTKDLTCVKLKTDGRWHVADCEEQLQFVCEKPILSGRICDIDGEFEI